MVFFRVAVLYRFYCIYVSWQDNSTCDIDSKRRHNFSTFVSSFYSLRTKQKYRKNYIGMEKRLLIRGGSRISGMGVHTYKGVRVALLI